MSVTNATMEEILAKFRITADQFGRMGEAGILPEDARLELLDGEILEMSPVGPAHAACVKQLIALFAPLLGQAVLSAQDPAALSQHSQPQPDFMLLRPRSDGYSKSHPGPEDILLLVEVSDTSVRRDRMEKGPIYARLGVREYWIVDIGSDLVEVHRRPEGELWGETRLFHRAEELAPAAFPEHRVAVESILPRSGTA